MECNIFVIRWLYLMSWFLVDKLFLNITKLKPIFFRFFYGIMHAEKRRVVKSKKHLTNNRLWKRKVRIFG